MFLEPNSEQREFQQAAEQFARDHVAAQAAHIDESGDFPRELMRQAGDLGLLGVTIGREWGGAARDYVSYALALEALARASATVAVIAAVNNSLVAEPIAKFGTDEQKQAWLPRLASGRSLGSFALSEESAGTDAANQKTQVPFDGMHHRLTGWKVWVANADG